MENTTFEVKDIFGDIIGEDSNSPELKRKKILLIN